MLPEKRNPVRRRREILTCGLAALVVGFLAQPAIAGHGGGGWTAGGHAPVPTHFSVGHAPAFHGNVIRAPSVPYFSYSRPAPAIHGPSAPHTSFTSPGPIVHSAPRATFSSSVTPNRPFTQPPRNVPGIAFGGHEINNHAPLNTPTNVRGFARKWAPPRDVTRGWDHGRIHEWHHHHFRYFGGDWGIIDFGYPYDYSYPYGYGYPYYYSEPAPDVAPSYALPTTAVVAGVQDQLTRLGYSPGPVDGVLGPQTRDAIADFQYGHGVPPTGQIDTALLQSLGLQ